MSTELYNADPLSGNELTQPYDLALVPAQMQAEDCPTQNTALQAVTFAPDSESDEQSKFNRKVPQLKSLKTFRTLYNDRNRHRAIDMLSRRTKIDFGSDEFTTGHRRFGIRPTG